MLCAVLVVGEEAGQYGRGSLLVRVDQLGPLAITAAKQLTFGTGTAWLSLLTITVKLILLQVHEVIFFNGKSIIGHFKGFFMEIKKVKISMKIPEKWPIICFSHNKEITSQTCRISSTLVVHKITEVPPPLFCGRV